MRNQRAELGKRQNQYQNVFSSRQPLLATCIQPHGELGKSLMNYVSELFSQGNSRRSILIPWLLPPKRSRVALGLLTSVPPHYPT